MTKPRLVFFQVRYDERLAPFILLQIHDHVKCLSQFFDVTVVNDDCDYDEVCDRYEPVLTLFESGVNHLTCRRPKIRNTSRHPRIPKLGFHNADGFCDARAGFLSDMEHWGIETFFAISTVAAEHTPQIADHLFVWPNFVDPDLYRDYGGWKSIPVLLTGNTGVLYPWRRRVLTQLADRFPTLVCPHPGYAAKTSDVEVLYGERYARTLNASVIVPTCGTVARDVVRKHFEIPACRACLVTERSAGIEAAGFKDMHNCVFVDAHDAVDKVATLFRNPDVLGAITDAGYELVHARHTLKHRSQILQWLLLSRRLQAHERIVQMNPFEPLAIVPAHASSQVHAAGEGLHLALLRDGDVRFRRGRYGDARRLYAQCMNYMPWMPEARLRLALCNLCEGDARSARVLIEALLEFTLGHYGAVDPDPVEWAYGIVAGLCLGRLDEARGRAREFPWLCHPELDRARWLTEVAGGAPGPIPIEAGSRPPRRTVHELPDTGVEAWASRVCTMLRACGRGDIAGAVQGALASAVLATAAVNNGESRPRPEAPAPDSRRPQPGGTPDSRRTFRRHAAYRMAVRRARLAAARVVRRIAGTNNALHRIVYGAQDHPLTRMLTRLTREGRIGSALIIGAAHDRPGTRAFIADGDSPTVFCVARTPRKGRMPGSGNPRWRVLTVPGMSPVDESFAGVMHAIATEHRPGVFDAVVIDTTALGDALPIDRLDDHVRRARYVALDGINEGNHGNFHRMMADPRYRLAACDPGRADGYAVFERRPPETTA